MFSRHSFGACLIFALTIGFSINSASANSNKPKAGDFNESSSREHLIRLVDKHARAHGVPVALARAVVRIESNWRPRTTGRAGEVGLMQIKHQTAKGEGYRGTRAALYDPETNIKWGMSYLAGAYRLAGGDTCGTVMRYQGGHGAKRMSSVARAYCGRARTLMASN